MEPLKVLLAKWLLNTAQNEAEVPSTRQAGFLATLIGIPRETETPGFHDYMELLGPLLKVPRQKGYKAHAVGEFGKQGKKGFGYGSVYTDSSTTTGRVYVPNSYWGASGENRKTLATPEFIQKQAREQTAAFLTALGQRIPEIEKEVEHAVPYRFEQNLEMLSQEMDPALSDVEKTLIYYFIVQNSSSTKSGFNYPTALEKYTASLPYKSFDDYAGAIGKVIGFDQQSVALALEQLSDMGFLVISKKDDMWNRGYSLPGVTLHPVIQRILEIEADSIDELLDRHFGPRPEAKLRRQDYDDYDEGKTATRRIDAIQGRVHQDISGKVQGWVGPRGTGKTSFTLVVEEETGIRFFFLSFQDNIVGKANDKKGVTTKTVSLLDRLEFDLKLAATLRRPAVLVIDDAEALFSDASLKDRLNRILDNCSVETIFIFNNINAIPEWFQSRLSPFEFFDIQAEERRAITMNKYIKECGLHGKLLEDVPEMARRYPEVLAPREIERAVRHVHSIFVARRARVHFTKSAGEPDAPARGKAAQRAVKEEYTYQEQKTDLMGALSRSARVMSGGVRPVPPPPLIKPVDYKPLFHGSGNYEEAMAAVMARSAHAGKIIAIQGRSGSGRNRLAQELLKKMGYNQPPEFADYYTMSSDGEYIHSAASPSLDLADRTSVPLVIRNATGLLYSMSHHHDFVLSAHEMSVPVVLLASPSRFGVPGPSKVVLNNMFFELHGMQTDPLLRMAAFYHFTRSEPDPRLSYFPEFNLHHLEATRQLMVAQEIARDTDFAINTLGTLIDVDFDGIQRLREENAGWATERMEDAVLAYPEPFQGSHVLSRVTHPSRANARSTVKVGPWSRTLS